MAFWSKSFYLPDRPKLCELVLRNKVTKEVLFNKIWHLYIISKNGKYYTGITTDLENRLSQHNNPQLLYKETFPDKHLAALREKKVKGFSRKKKEGLFAKSL